LVHGAHAPGEYKAKMTGPGRKAVVTALTVTTSPMNLKVQ
jgi:hypothetical protein